MVRKGSPVRVRQRACFECARLPAATPDDLVAIGFAALFDEYERKLCEIGARVGPNLFAGEIAALRRQLEWICVTGPRPFTRDEVPSLTADPDDDPIVYGALLADADFVLSDDRDIVPDSTRQRYEHEDHQTLAVTFNEFVSHHVRPSPFPWDGVDPALLAGHTRTRRAQRRRMSVPSWGSVPSLTERVQEWIAAAFAVTLVFHETICSGGNGTQY